MRRGGERAWGIEEKRQGEREKEKKRRKGDKFAESFQRIYVKRLIQR